MRKQIIAVFPVTISKSKDTFSCKEQPDILFFLNLVFWFWESNSERIGRIYVDA